MVDMNVEIQKALAERIEAYCLKNKTEPNEFVFDAIIEKLELAYRERRRRPRI